MKYILIAALCMSSCDVNRQPYSVENYTCTNEQLDAVKKHFDMCMKTSYTSVYCYYLSVKAYCGLKDPAPRLKEGE